MTLPQHLVAQWRIEGTLTTLSPLRVGDGNVDMSRLPDPHAEIATCFASSAGKPYIPGSSLRGFLRSYCKQRLPEKIFNDLFGYQREVKGAIESADALGGRLAVYDAMWIGSPSGEIGSYWDQRKGTCVASHVVIDRETGAPADGLLFFEEYVPANSAFHVTLLTEGPAPSSDIAAVLAALRTIENSPARLGASHADDWGHVRWELESLRHLTDKSLERWKASSSALLADCLDVFDVGNLPPATILPLQSEFIELSLEVRLEGALLVNDPSRTKKGSDDPTDTRPDHAPCRTPDGRPFLPSSSFRGSLRAQAEKIARTLGIDASPIVDRGQAQQQPSSNIPALDPVGRLFGAAGWRACVSISDFVADGPQPSRRQEFIAIDRFTGGAAPGLKFNAEYYWRPVLQGRIQIDVRRLKESKGTGSLDQIWLLLAFVLRDLAEGDVRLGFGAAKGYGDCRAEIHLASAAPERIPAALRPWFVKGFGPARLPVFESAPEAPVRLTASQPPVHHFYNPYHFVPVSQPRTSGLTDKQLRARKDLGNVTHGRYVPGTFSGTLFCQLVNETPLIIGSEQSGEAPKRVEFFRVPGEEGREDLAIPASTLRGLISSVAEAASSSALRVLHNPEVYSRRSQMKEPLSAIGMVVRRKVGEKIAWFIRPLCLPVFRSGQLDPIWQRYFQRPLLRTYFGSAEKIRSEEFLRDFSTWTPARRMEAELRVPKLQWTENQFGRLDHPSLQIRDLNILAVRTDPRAPKVKGIMRVLGADRGRRDIVATKKHEVFIPCPDATDYIVDGAGKPEANLIPLPESVRERFHRLANEMTDQWRGPTEDVRPYELWGTRPGRAETGGKLELRPGDLVYFDLRSQMGAAIVKELSFSSIWRKQINGRCHDYFGRISQDLLPMGPTRFRNRKNDVPVTIAERMFGLVEVREQGHDQRQDPQPSLALASRVRFSNGRWRSRPENPLGQEVTLKILSSPKLPSPCFYFRRSSGDVIQKSDLRDDANPPHRPQGRKFYLHHASALNGQTPWVTANPGDSVAQKVRVCPLQSGHSFDFSVEFDNLNQEELSLLTYALRPSPQFRHKLGLGKPLGLGSVRIEILGLARVVRETRYSISGLHMERWTPAPLPALFEPLPEIRQALLAIGQTVFDKVNYPETRGPHGQETEHFKWFVANGRAKSSAVGLDSEAPITPLPQH